MASIRSCMPEDLFALQSCNTANLPENYQMKYYFYHFLSWPQLLYIAETDTQDTAGYVLAKMNEESDPKCHGHITSISVSRAYRKQGIARHLMDSAHQAMQTTFNAEYSSLHVRISNRAAYSLYAFLGYKKHDVEKMYYSDKEDALSLRCLFPYGEAQNALRLEAKQRKAHDSSQERQCNPHISSSLDANGKATEDSMEQKVNSNRSSLKSQKKKKNKS